jgi:hypothetical protein|tara:strand:+ start:795 stop:1010 length:216 start_codon:yes stop_codon:yes gene_type:complete
MAIDSAEKRRSAFGVFDGRGIPSVTPNSSKDAEWRQEVLWGYSGIAAASPGGVTAFRNYMFYERLMAGEQL